jgi:hypothetical protein
MKHSLHAKYNFFLKSHYCIKSLDQVVTVVSLHSPAARPDISIWNSYYGILNSGKFWYWTQVSHTEKAARPCTNNSHVLCILHWTEQVRGRSYWTHVGGLAVA